VVSWLDAVAAWVAGLWPGSVAASAPTAAPQALGGDIDPDGTAAESRGAGTSLGDGPTVEPKLGGYVDPSG
jgi:hypothetical protein